MAHEDIIKLIEQHDEISEEDASAIVTALAAKVPLDPEWVPEPEGRLTHSTGDRGSRIHTHVSSLSSRDSWLCYLWLTDAIEELGHIPSHLACLRETFAHSVGADYIERAVEKVRARAAQNAEAFRPRGSASEGPESS